MHVLKAQDFPRRPQEIPVEENGATQTQDKGRPRTEEPQAWDEPYPSPISDRISWVFALIVSIRLMYWKTGDPSHDRTQPPTRLTRLAYFRYASATVISSYLIVDTAAFYNLHDPYFAHPNMAIDTPIPHPARDTPTVLTLLRVLPPRLVRSASIGAHAYGLISLGGSFPTIFVIFLNKLGLIPDVWSPQNWPIFFGPFSAVVNRGLRGLWGTWWHQTVRYLGSMPGRSLSHRLGFSPGSVMDYALRATSAFILSGVIHTGLVPPEPSFATLPTWKIKLHIAAFFWVQIPAFGIEMLMLRVARRTFPNASRIFWVKLVVVGWVCGWLCLTIPVLAVALKELGYWRTYPLPLSLWQGLSGRGWWPWAEF
ncbi:hypothetical protein MMC24_001365 [Lignoscripta atroalba]|nr:hypothetical protein [Lignoscripta atroalba]